MVAGHHGLLFDLTLIRRHFQPSSRGTSLNSLIGIADRMEMSARALRLDMGMLHKLRLPAVLHWGFSHFVVVTDVRGARAHILNPDGQSGWIDFAEVSKHFTGVALELRPTQHFRPQDLRTRLRLSQLWHRITGLGGALVQILVLSLVLQAYVILSPYYMQIAIDTVLPSLDLDLLTVLAFGFGLFAVINAITAWLRGQVALSTGASVGYGLTSNLARRLFRLPLDWFERRQLGDILSRFQSIMPIQTLLAEGAVAVVVDGLLAIFTLLMMLLYSPTLALVAVLALALYLAVRCATFTSERQAQEAGIVARGIEQTYFIESLRGITALRLANKETMRHSVWQSRLTDSVNQTIRLGRLGNGQAAGYTLVFALESVVSLYLAIGFVIAGGFSIGMVFAYTAYKMQFFEKAKSLVDKGVAVRILGLHLDRLSDVALAQEDICFQYTHARPTRLTGAIALKGVNYRYSGSDPLVLDDVNLSIDPGEHLVVTGTSGGGKSTLVKVLLGLVEPVSGEVLIDGIPLAQFGHQSYHEQIGAVLQEDTLFLGSLSFNISLFDDKPDEERLIAAATAAAIHDDIMRMPMTYDTLVGDMGSTLSGGQKQRVLLARALYRRPRLLVLDEGTAHLDAEHEATVNRSIDALGITRIMIAHRQETIAAASRVVRIEKGRIVADDRVRPLCVVADNKQIS